MDSQKEILRGQREVSDLPAEMMLFARDFDEAGIYRAASAFEKAGE